VLGDIPSLREVWGDAALYADPFDGAAIGRAVRDALDDASALGAAARRRAAGYTTDAMAEAYAATYGRLTSARGAA
jgi:glycosyltransferase involved in cell wall biosynthesis